MALAQRDSPDPRLKELEGLLKGVTVREYGPQSANMTIELRKGALRYVVGPGGEILEKYGRSLFGFGAEKALVPGKGDVKRVGSILEAHTLVREAPSVVQRDETRVGGRLTHVGQHSLEEWEAALDKVLVKMEGIAPVGVVETLKDRTIGGYLKAWAGDPAKWDPEGNFHRNIFIYAARDIGYDLGRAKTACLLEVAVTELLKRHRPKETAAELEGLRGEKEGASKEAKYRRAGYSAEDLYWVKAA